MKLEQIISISGKPGLYKLVSQSKGGFIVEDLTTGKKTSISAQNQVSVLDNIAIYTYEEDKPLGEIFQTMFAQNNGEKTISHKSPEKELRDKMRELVKDYDEDRVYTSDIKKLFNWYNLLVENNMIELTGDEEAIEEE